MGARAGTRSSRAHSVFCLYPQGGTRCAPLPWAEIRKPFRLGAGGILRAFWGSMTLENGAEDS